jgi:hypothetical protein
MATPTSEGQLFTRTTWANYTQTLLACGKHHNDSITGEPLDEPVYLFIAFDGNMVSRGRLTAAECADLTLSTAPLTSRQQASLASLAFRNWEQNEYRRLGVLV